MPKLFHMCRKDLSAWVPIPAITFLGEQTTGQKTMSLWLFSLETKWRFCKLNSANTHQLKVKLWSGPNLYMAPLLGTTICHLPLTSTTRSCLFLILITVPPHAPLCLQLAYNQYFSAHQCLDNALLSSGISSLNCQPFLDSGPKATGSHLQVHNNNE